MGTIRVQNVTCQFGGQVVLRDVSLDLHDGEIVGVVGPNGAGKSTLFKLIAGLLPLELGTITRSKGLEVGYLAQEPQLESHRSVLAEVSVGLADLTRMERRLHELAERIAAEHGTSGESQLLAEYDRLTAQFQAAGGYEAGQRLREIVGGLGFSQEDLDRPVGTLSGGQKCRVALARLLLEDRQFLLLDEPTNHLDIDAVRWLERFLAGHHGGAAIISHDRYLLDRVAQKIIEVDRQTVTVYTGNYSTYADTRALRRLSLERQYERDAAFLAKEREFIARHLAGQRTKEAQGRRDRLERRLAAGEFVLEKPKERKGLEFSFAEEKARSGPVLRVEDLAKSFPNRRLFADLNLNLEAGKCLGITGPNGTGKTTLLRILLGQLPPDAGEVQFQPQLSIGYYAQEAALPNPEQTPLEAIHVHRPALDETRIRSLLGRFGFRGDDVFKPLGRCSGGEQSRVRLLGLILDNPNMLVLDEPTNHLDIAAREALEDALLEFPGAILVVSHDRYFLDRLVDDLLVMRPEGTRLHRGDYSSYIAELEAAKTEAASPSPAPTAPAGRGKAAPDRSPRAGSRQPRPTAKYDALSIEQIEELIIQREEEVARLTERFADPQLIRDPAGLARLHADIDALKAELAVLDAAWHERADAV